MAVLSRPKAADHDHGEDPTPCRESAAHAGRLQPSLYATPRHDADTAPGRAPRRMLAAHSPRCTRPTKHDADTAPGRAPRHMLAADTAHRCARPPMHDADTALAALRATCRRPTQPIAALDRPRHVADTAPDRAPPSFYRARFSRFANLAGFGPGSPGSRAGRLRTCQVRPVLILAPAGQLRTCQVRLTN